MAWWPAWVFGAIFLVTGIGGRIWAEQRHPGLSAERQDIDKMKQAKSWDRILAPLMAFTVIFPLVIVAGLDHRFGWSTAMSGWLVLTGLLLVLLGYAFAAWALAENRFFSSVVRIQTDRGHSVCDTGPYRVVRHPGYAGVVVAMLGMILALESLWTTIPALLALIITLVRTALEDRTLRDELPGYADYGRRVRYRLAPGIY